MANVLFTLREGSSDNYIVSTTNAKLLVTLPPINTARPFVLVINRDLGNEFFDRRVMDLYRELNITKSKHIMVQMLETLILFGLYL